MVHNLELGELGETSARSLGTGLRLTAWRRGAAADAAGRRWRWNGSFSEHVKILIHFEQRAYREVRSQN
jgi:hypothetical protein